VFLNAPRHSESRSGGTHHSRLRTWFLHEYSRRIAH
jgi:hypothetical protein